MRIVYDCLVELCLRDGHALHTRTIVETLGASGDDIDLFGPTAGYDPASPGVRCARVPFLGYSPLRVRLYRALLGRAMRRTIAARRPRCIIHKIAPTLPTVVEVARRTGTPLAIELNGELDGDDGWSDRMIRAGLAATARLDSLLLLGVSPELPDRYAPWIGCRDVRTEVFENGFDPGIFGVGSAPADRSAWGIAEDAFVIGHVGASNPAYDFAIAFAGAERARARGVPVHFLVVGPETLAARLRPLAAQHGLTDRLTILPPVEHAEVPALVAAMDCGMVLCTEEKAHMAPTALKLPEMLVSGVPCLVNVPASWERWPLASSVAGLTTVDAEMVAARICEIHADPAGERRRTAEAARILREQYSWPVALERYRDAVRSYAAMSQTDVSIGSRRVLTAGA